MVPVPAMFWSLFFFKVELKLDRNEKMDLDLPQAAQSSHRGISIGAAGPSDAGVGSSAAGTCCSQSWWTAFLIPYFTLTASARSKLSWRHLPGVVGSTFLQHANPEGPAETLCLQAWLHIWFYSCPEHHYFLLFFSLFDQTEITSKKHWLAIKGSKRIKVRLIWCVLVFNQLCCFTSQLMLNYQMKPSDQIKQLTARNWSFG